MDKSSRNASPQRVTMRNFAGDSNSRLSTMKYTQASLDKIERILDEAEYIVRYERGTFQSGYCILEQKKVVVLNKFLQLEGRINTLIDIIPQLKIFPELLTPDAKKVYDEVLVMHQSADASTDQ